MLLGPTKTVVPTGGRAWMTSPTSVPLCPLPSLLWTLPLKLQSYWVLHCLKTTLWPGLLCSYSSCLGDANKMTTSSRPVWSTKGAQDQPRLKNKHVIRINKCSSMVVDLPGIYKVVGSIPNASNKTKHSPSFWCLRIKD